MAELWIIGADVILRNLEYRLEHVNVLKDLNRINLLSLTKVPVPFSRQNFSDARELTKRTMM